MLSPLLFFLSLTPSALPQEAASPLVTGLDVRLGLESRSPAPASRAGRAAERTRLRIHGALDSGPEWRAYSELQISGSLAGQPTTTGLHQAWIEVDNVADLGLDLRFGRFELSYGRKRMLSAREWTIPGVAFDGVLGNFQLAGWEADAFTAWAVRDQGGDHPNDRLAGVYGEGEVLGRPADAYVLMRRDDGDTQDTTFGVLLEDQLAGGVAWNAEIAMQSGTHSGGDASGTALALQADYPFFPRMRVGAGLDYASGPADGADGFLPLWNSTFLHQGFMAVADWSNLMDLSLFGTWQVQRKWTARLELHSMTLAESGTDPVLGPGAGAWALAGGNSLGTELDFVLKGSLAEGLDLWLGLGTFSPGDVFAPNSETQTWLFFETILSF